MFTCFGCSRQNVALVMEWFRDFCPNETCDANIDDEMPIDDKDDGDYK